MLDREYLDWVNQNEIYDELEGFGNFTDSEVLAGMPVNYSDFEKAISEYIKDTEIQPAPLYCLCSYFYHFTTKNNIFVLPRNGVYDSYLQLEIWLKRNHVKKIYFTNGKQGKDNSFDITDKKFIHKLISQILEHPLRRIATLEYSDTKTTLKQLPASQFHDKSFVAYYFFKLIDDLINNIEPRIETSILQRKKQLIVTLMLLFGFRRQQTNTLSDKTKCTNYDNIKRNAKQFWKEYDYSGLNAKQKYKKQIINKNKHGYFAKPNYSWNPYETWKRQMIYYKLKGWVND